MLFLNLLHKLLIRVTDSRRWRAMNSAIELFGYGLEFIRVIEATAMPGAMFQGRAENTRQSRSRSSGSSLRSCQCLFRADNTRRSRSSASSRHSCQCLFEQNMK